MSDIEIDVIIFPLVPMLKILLFLDFHEFSTKVMKSLMLWLHPGVGELNLWISKENFIFKCLTLGGGPVHLHDMCGKVTYMPNRGKWEGVPKHKINYKFEALVR